METEEQQKELKMAQDHMKSYRYKVRVNDPVVQSEVPPIKFLSKLFKPIRIFFSTNII